MGGPLEGRQLPKVVSSAAEFSLAWTSVLTCLLCLCLKQSPSQPQAYILSSPLNNSLLFVLLFKENNHSSKSPLLGKGSGVASH